MTTAQLQHFAVLTLEQTLTPTGYQIVVTTNNPCHLWMRWTNLQPHPHIYLELDRGTFIQRLKRYATCFWENNEQQEAGDTLTHTFIKEPWPSCETRYFFFWGTVNGQDSLSTSPIFKKHRPTYIPELPFIEPWTWEEVPMPTYTLKFTEPWTS